MYLLIWFITEIIAAIIIPSAMGWILIVLSIIALYRIFEIFQAGVNLNIFDRLRIGDRPHYVATLARTLILSLWNYFELWICFGIIYSSSLSTFTGKKNILDAYYFSIITQLTIGNGDISPLGITRLFVCIQGLLGFMFGLFALSRLISFLPRLQPVVHDD